jgi:flagellar hook-associated protein 1 FlgK
VDLDNEAAELLRFQQAYSASAKIIQAARETLQDILNLF